MGEKENQHKMLLDFGAAFLVVFAVSRVPNSISSPAFTSSSGFFPSSLSFLKLPFCPDLLISLLSISLCQVPVVYTLFALSVFFFFLSYHVLISVFFILSHFSAHFIS